MCLHACVAAYYVQNAFRENLILNYIPLKNPIVLIKTVVYHGKRSNTLFIWRFE